MWPALLAVGCAPALPPRMGLGAVEGPSALLVRPKSSDWASNLVAGKALAQARREVSQSLAPHRRLQAAMSPLSEARSLRYGSSLSTGSIGSAPTYFYGDGTAYWLTDTGWILKRTAAGVASAFKVPGVDLFPNTALVISNDGKRLYLHAASGTFYAVDSTNGQKVPGRPVVLGGANASVGFGPPSFLDAGASLGSGFSETLYLVSNKGVLHHILGAREGGPPGGIQHVQSYVLPLTNTATYTELVRSGPVVYRGRVVVSVWRRHNTTSTSDQGALVNFNTNATAYTGNGTIGTVVRRVDLAEPAWAPPTVEYDFNQANVPPLLAFVTTGASATMVDMNTGEVAKSVPLVVDNTTSLSGNLSTYPYSATGISTVNVTPTANTALSLYSNGALDAANLHGAATVGNGLFEAANNRSVYGLMRFPITTATVTVGGVIKAITKEFSGAYLYVDDEHSGTNRVSLNRFTLGSATTAPILDSALLLSNASGAVQSPTNSMAWDFAGNRLFFATRNASNTHGRTWVVNRF